MLARAAGPARAAARIARILGLAAEVARRGRSASGPDVAAAHAASLAQACATAMDALGFDIRVEGPLPRPGVLLASNHLSYVDPVVIAARVPCIPISKADLASWPVFGRTAAATGVLFIARGDTRSGIQVMRRAQELMQSGTSVLNFPEGTTTRGDLVLPFRPGLFGTALRAGVDVVPVALSYDPPEVAWIGDDTFVPHFLRLTARPRTTVRLAFGEPIPSGDHPDSASLALATHDRIADLLARRTPCLKTLP